MQPRTITFCRVAATAVALALWPSTAWADEISEATKKSARELGLEGGALYDKGDYAGALDKLDRAYALYPAPTIGLWSAQAMVELGKLVEASERYLDVVQRPLEKDASPALTEAKDTAKREYDALEPRIPRLMLKLEGAQAAEVSIELDGKDVPSAIVGVAHPVNPGKHAVAAAWRGQHVSSAFEATERGTATVVLAFEPIAQAAAPPAPRAAKPPAPAPATTRSPLPAEPTLEQRLEESTWTPVVHVGFITTGKGEVETECSTRGTQQIVGNPTPTCNSGSEKYSDKSGFAFGADLLLRTTPALRVGIGTLVVLDPRSQFDWGDLESGTEVSLFAVGDGVFPVSTKIGIVVRGFVGVTALFAGEAHSEAIEKNREACKTSSIPCDTSSGPFFGPTGGVGAGAMYQTSTIAWRAELVGQRLMYPLFENSSEANGVKVEQKDQLTGNRVYLFVGAEF